MPERELREELGRIVERAYRAGRQSIQDGICSGTSLDDAYIAEEIQGIVQEIIQEWDNDIRRAHWEDFRATLRALRDAVLHPVRPKIEIKDE